MKIQMRQKFFRWNYDFNLYLGIKRMDCSRYLLCHQLILTCETYIYIYMDKAYFELDVWWQIEVQFSKSCECLTK